MMRIKILSVCLLLSFSAVTCKKNTAENHPLIWDYRPGTIFNGTEVTLLAFKLGNDLSAITIYSDGTPVTPTSLSTESVKFIMPLATATGSPRTVRVTVKAAGLESNGINLLVNP